MHYLSIMKLLFAISKEVNICLFLRRNVHSTINFVLLTWTRHTKSTANTNKVHVCPYKTFLLKIVCSEAKVCKQRYKQSFSIMYYFDDYYQRRECTLTSKIFDCQSQLVNVTMINMFKTCLMNSCKLTTSCWLVV
jgi:hypothetical protein